MGLGLGVGGLHLDDDLRRPIQGGLVLGFSGGSDNAADPWAGLDDAVNL